MRQTNQRGIAIAPILFIVAILAVLAAAIAAGSGSFNGDTSAISAKAQAAAILEQANAVKFAVDRVLGKGCTDTQISFENPIVSGYTNPNAPSDKSCHVFDVNGGGINFPTITASTSETTDGGRFVFEGSTQFFGLGITNIGNVNGSELAGYLPIDSLYLCNQINTLLGLGGYLGGDTYFDPDNLSYGRFTGTYNGSANAASDNGGTWPQGRLMGCFQRGLELPHNGFYYPNIAPYFFFVVLIVR